MFYEILNVYPKLIQVHLHKHLREGEPLRHWIVVSDFLTLFGDLESFSGSGLNIHANNRHAVCPLCWDYAFLPGGRNHLKIGPLKLGNRTKSGNDPTSYLPFPPAIA